MVQTIKSVLLVDFDSIYTNLQRRDLGAGDLLATRSASWLGAIESGELIVPKGDASVQRRLMVKRCYADPKLLNKGRSWMSAKGVQIVDCPPSQGRDKNSAHVHMVLDALDALEHASGFDEFILMTGDADLSPMLFRLRAYNRRTVIYAAQGTAAAYRAYADAVIEESSLLSLLRSGRAGGIADSDPAGIDFDDAQAASDGTIDRETLSALARRLNQATKVPLFSTKVYGDLFRLVVLEVAENGYRFQTTAENVAARMTATGRNVTRRQVGFVVKGLALRGHVFSATDSREQLATVFHQQVLFLAQSAQMKLTREEERMLGIWIVGRSVAPARPAVTTAPAIPEPMDLPEVLDQDDEAPEAELAPPPPPPPVRQAPQQPARAAQPQPQHLSPAREFKPIPSPQPMSPQPMPQRPSRTQPQPAPAAQQPQPQPQAQPQPPVPAQRQPARQQPAAPAARPQPPQRPQPAPPETPQTRFAHRLKRAAAPPADAWDETTEQPLEPIPASPRFPAASPPPPQARRAPAPRGNRGNQPAAPETAGGAGKGAMENSILAAIAQAVDVRVENTSTDELPVPVPAPGRQQRQPSVRPSETPQATGGEEDSGDIGDEIQRILAGYNRDRGRG